MIPFLLAAAAVSCLINGKPYIGDRQPAECDSVKVHDQSGAVRGVKQRPPTEEERSVTEEESRRSAAELSRIRAEGRRNANLLQRFPTPAAHDRSRQLALSSTLFSIRSAEARVRELSEARQRTLNELEFHPKVKPPKLQRELDSIEAALAAQRLLLIGQRAEAERIDGWYDEELARLRKLWGRQ